MTQSRLAFQCSTYLNSPGALGLQYSSDERFSGTATTTSFARSKASRNADAFEGSTVIFTWMDVVIADGILRPLAALLELQKGRWSSVCFMDDEFHFRIATVLYIQISHPGSSEYGIKECASGRPVLWTAERGGIPQENKCKQYLAIHINATRSMSRRSMKLPWNCTAQAHGRKLKHVSRDTELEH